MHSLSLLSALLAVAGPSLAAPTYPIPSNSSTATGASGASSALDCSQYSPATSGDYVVNPDQWGQVSPGTCVQIHAFSDGGLSWSAQWSWPGGGTNVKSYPNAELGNWECKPLSSYQTIQSSWTWDYSPDPTSADVSYDAFVSDGSCGAGHKAEVMIWLAAYNLNPISNTGATPYKTSAIPGWNLYVGTNSQTGVPAYSFVSQSSPMKSYSGNLLSFFSYLETEGLINGSEYLQEMHAGTEPASGDGVVFTTSSFTLSSA